MTETDEFLPQWTSPPGHTIRDLMSTRQISPSDLAGLLEEPLSFVEGLLEGREAITLRLARRLEETVGGSAAFWMTRDRQYRDDVLRLRDEGVPWLREFPLVDMERFGWIPAEPPTGFEVESMLRYFAVPSVPAWRARYAAVLDEAAFRTSPTFTSTPGAVAAWLRQGQRIAESVSCGSWNEEALRGLLPELRALTRLRNPETFIPKLCAAVADCGIALVVLQAPSGCRASGAVQWLTEDKVLILLSARHLTDDHFWFTFFHECGHVLLHRRSRFVLDDEEERQTGMEDEANAFAAEVLIPFSHREALARVRLETFDVLRLATRLGVSPGIVVAQLQRTGRLPKSYLNRLKRRFAWDDGRLVIRETA
jgi:plasmid maintenance system antidote protein VapI